MQGTAQETKKLDVDILKVPVDTDGSESTSSEERSDSDESDEESVSLFVVSPSSFAGVFSS